MREREGDLNSAITLYMKAGLPAKAAKLVMHHQACLILRVVVVVVVVVVPDLLLLLSVLRVISCD